MNTNDIRCIKLTSSMDLSTGESEIRILARCFFCLFCGGIFKRNQICAIIDPQKGLLLHTIDRFLKKTGTYKVLNFVEGEPETKKSPCEHKQLSNGNDSLSVGKLSKT